MGNVQGQAAALPERTILIERHFDQRLPHQLLVRLEYARMSFMKVPTAVRHESPTTPPPPIAVEHTPDRHSPAPYKTKPTVRMIGELLSKWLIYAMVIVFLALNIYALLNRVNTILFLRIYQLAVACIMVLTSIVMLEFLVYARKNLPKLNTPHKIPRPMFFSTLILSVGIVIGYAYFIVFSLAFQDCDVLVDTTNPSDVWLDIAYEVGMIWFCIISFIYLMQRGYYGSVNYHSDKLRRAFINGTICIAWIQVVVYKGYLSHQVLCQRRELAGYWCPDNRQYTCDTHDLEGTRQIWYFLNKGLLNSTVIACASEFFPQKKSVRRVLGRFMADISRIYGAQHKHVSLPPLRTAPSFAYILCGLSVILFHWLVKFYSTILFAKLYKEGWMFDDYVQFFSGLVHIFFHAAVYFWTTRIEERRFDAHHKAEARGDIVLILGCCILLTFKFVLQFVELDFQSSDGFITTFSCVLQMIFLVTTIGSQWLQFFSLRRILALGDRVIIETTIVKYQITNEQEFGFHQVTLISMTVSQSIYPADYLFAFTVAGCWMDLIYRYSRMGYFQMGQPPLDQLEFDNHSILSATTVSRRPTTTHGAPPLVAHDKRERGRR
ncbi:hypothetical protein M3Y99_01397800 [Aphelenchoides fujianensis]|nr:hypothetical protein M3Y99_01397800 [Aphelenchoides fujianensis]